MRKVQILISEVKSWLLEAGERLKEALLDEKLQVDTKLSRTDLVTNLDKEIQDFLVDKIMTFDPKAKILGEENGQDKLEDFSGRVFVIDPIDGTMNFVLEGENFCIMVAIYEEGKGVLGFIYDVMKNEFLWGGPSIGVYVNEERVQQTKYLSLEEGLLGVNAKMYTHNIGNLQAIGDVSMGIRMCGCAGVEFIHLALGRRAGYISNLAPWDYAAGQILVETLGMTVTKFDGEPLNLDEREFCVAAGAAAYTQILKLSLENKEGY